MNALKLTDAVDARPKIQKCEPNVPKQPLHPNTIWIKENSHLYRGRYVALKDGQFIASGRTIKEADQAARAKGVDKPMLHYVLAEGEEAFYSGW